MALDVVVPKLGLTMEEGTLIEWHRADGERVAKGEPLFTVETDKVAYEVLAEADGLVQRLVAVDAVLPVGAVVGRLLAETDAGAAGRADVAVPSGPVTAQPPRAPSFAAPTAATCAQTPPSTPPSAVRPPSGAPAGRIRSSPIARRIAAEHGIDLARVTPSGAGGVVLRRDVDAALRTARPAAASPADPPQAARTAPVAVPPAAAPAVAAPAAVAPATDPGRPVRRRPLAGTRRAIAQRMTASLAASAQLTAFARVDMGEAESLRRSLAADADTIGVRVTVTDIVLKCVGAALRATPELRAWIDGDEIVSVDAVDVGLAVALDDGLVVPVIRDVDRLPLAELARTRAEVVGRARAGRLVREDLVGGSFTLSNFGSYGGDMETPILNPPQSAMLGIGRIADDVVARDGAPVVRPTMWLSMTYDHRLIDGALAGRFRARLKSLLEQPLRVLAAPG
jgi:pyruvate dehydrogenase E2 component (dihydrolipoamide acetyltransferase)